MSDTTVPVTGNYATVILASGEVGRAKFFFELSRMLAKVVTNQSLQFGTWKQGAVSYFVGNVQKASKLQPSFSTIFAETVCLRRKMKAEKRSKNNLLIIT